MKDEKKNNFSQKEKQEIVASLKKEIRDEVFAWIKRWRLIIIGSLSVCSVIGVVIMCAKIYFNVQKKASEYITESITDKFAEPNIQKTLQGVASEEAQSIIANEVRPETEKIKGKVNAFESYLTESRTKFEKEYNTLAEQIAVLDARNRILELLDKAINEGDRQAYESLKVLGNVPTQDSFSKAATAATLQVKSFYLRVTRIKTADLEYKKNSDGTKLKNNDIPTDSLEKVLLTDPDWRIRTKAAELLGNRKEKRVPPVLLQAIQNDSNLDVLKAALDSFEKVTDYPRADVLNSDPAVKWWEKSRVEIEPKLK